MTATAVRTTLRMSISLKGSPPLWLDRVAFLQGVEPGVEAARGYQLFVGARLGDAAVLENEYRVNAPDQPELVCDDEGGASFGQDPPALLDGGRCLGVEAGLGLVQDQDGRVPQHGPGDGYALPLPPAQALAALGEHGVVALWQLLDKPVGPRELGDGFDLLPARPRPPVCYVLGDARPEEQRVLRHEGYGVAQRLEGEVLVVFPVDEHPPL